MSQSAITFKMNRDRAPDELLRGLLHQGDLGN
jgi:hypothetical protein